jgi:hypothetical protein
MPRRPDLLNLKREDQVKLKHYQANRVTVVVLLAGSLLSTDSQGARKY